MGERVVRNDEVEGSIPFASTIRRAGHPAGKNTKKEHHRDTERTEVTELFRKDRSQPVPRRVSVVSVDSVSLW